MSGKTLSRGNGKSITRKLFLAGGILLAAGQLGALLWDCRAFLHRFGAGAPGFWGGAGFASLHLVRSAAFNPEVMFWFVLKMLVLSLAFGFIVTGLAFTRSGAAGPTTENRSTRGSRRGDQ